MWEIHKSGSVRGIDVPYINLEINGGDIVCLLDIDLEFF
jgi:hypothetical protein